MHFSWISRRARAARKPGGGCLGTGRSGCGGGAHPPTSGRVGALRRRPPPTGEPPIASGGEGRGGQGKRRRDATERRRRSRDRAYHRSTNRNAARSLFAGVEFWNRLRGRKGNKLSPPRFHDPASRRRGAAAAETPRTKTLARRAAPSNATPAAPLGRLMKRDFIRRWHAICIEKSNWPSAGQ